MLRTLRGVLVIATAILLSLGGASAAQAVSVAEGDLIIEDTAGRLHLPQLEEELAEIDFYAPTTVVVYTYSGEFSDNMNTEVLAYAREQHPEWISDDGQKWADGLFVFALDPDGRQVGTYFGEDRSVPLSDQSAIQDAAKEDFATGDWTPGVVAGVQAAAAIIERPWYASPAFIGTAWIGGGAIAVSGMVVLFVRGSRRQSFADHLKQGSTHLTAVTMDLDETELAARTLPSSSPFAQRLEQRFSDFSQRYHRALEEQDRLEAMTSKERSRAAGVTEAKAFAEETAEMDFVDDAIVNAAALLTKSSTWERAWAAQVDPIREDLAAIPSLASEPAAAGLPTTEALGSFQSSATAELERLGAGLRDGALEPADALEGLEAVRTQLSQLLIDHSSAMIAAYTEEESEREALAEQLEQQRRTNRARSGSILDTVSSPGQYWSPVSFSAGYSAGVSQVETSRSAGSSSFGGGSSVGYGSSGGSFSGSGSSSRF
jgi:hypothetical protein